MIHDWNSGVNEIELVKMVLAYHQRAYAKFHCTQGYGVIEAEGMAIGETSVEVSKWLNAQLARGRAARLMREER